MFIETSTRTQKIIASFMQWFTLNEMSSSAAVVELQAPAEVKAKSRTFNLYTVLLILKLEA